LHGVGLQFSVPASKCPSGISARRSTSTEALPADLSGTSAPPIPYGQNIAWLDMQSSPQTLDLAFDRQLPASPYDWEVHLHVRLLIATQLSQGQRFEEARLWFHTIFDPHPQRWRERFHALLGASSPFRMRPAARASTKCWPRSRVASTISARKSQRGATIRSTHT